MFYGDGVITPAISVLSAVEGLEVAAPALHDLHRADLARVLIALFMVQRHGTGGSASSSARSWRSGSSRSRCWASAHIVDNPAVLEALSPHHAVLFMIAHPWSVLRARLGRPRVTGAEALYADMGHFGKRPIRMAWFGVVDTGAAAQLLRPGCVVLATRR